MSIKTKCKLNSDGSVCLRDILESFNSAIREEHAWALCYQCVKYFIEATAENREGYYIVTDVSHIFLQTDGNLHPKTLQASGRDANCLTLLTDDQELVTGLGCIIYNALDYGNNNGEERAITHDLEQLINDMITEDRSVQETDDEGIERDSEEGDHDAHRCQATLRQVLQRCERHLNTLTKTQAEAHYKAVVRALVAEALELATFLEKVAHGMLQNKEGGSTSDLDQLQFADWARFWVQVIAELRMGVKLKKVHYSKAPIEYELTPYEILMKDIRSCRYNLRKIMVNGDIPYRVTTDAHAIILDFIRSRPPLKKVSERKLTPRLRTFTPREQLMNSIKIGWKLRPTSRRLSRTSEDLPDEERKPSRRLIKVDFSQLQDDEEEDETDNSLSPGLWQHEEYRQLCDDALEAYDLATRCPYRHHSLQIPLGSQSVPQSRPCSRQSCNSSDTDSVALPPEVARTIQDQLITGMTLEDRLSLTLEEIVHIRSVLTKAELDGLPVEADVRADVENKRVCFLCLKTRFGIFGPWGQKCTLCKQIVCSKCFSRMHIPMEHFSSVPVVMLSPSIMDNQPFLRSPKVDVPDNYSSAISRFRYRASTVGKAAMATRGSQMVVCHDCKTMVLQIIRAARSNRSAVRNKTIQSLTLNLSPVF